MALEGIQFSHYHLLTLIGKGGMGEVYLAEDTKIQRQVAVKLIRIEMVQMDQQSMDSALHLFWREATAIGRLDHPSILPLYDHGETKIEGRDVAYLILPYRPEGSLVAWLRKRGQAQQTQQLTLKQVVHLIRQASQGLQYAHDREVMHLDVKPANFLIRSNLKADAYPDLLLGDFGIARLASATSSTSQHISGTPTYMAPEQWANKPVFASDQYALGIMTYELLTGSPPFQGPPMSVMFAHIHEQPEPVHKRNPLLPPAIDLVLQRALAKKPEERYSSIATFAQVFEQAFQGMSEESTLRQLRPSLSTPPTPGAPSVNSPVVSDRALPSSHPRPAQPFASALPVATVQEKVTLPPTTSPDAIDIPAPHAPTAPRQAAIVSPGPATLPPLPAPVRPNRPRSLVLVGGLLLLILVLVAGGSFGIWRVVTRTGHPQAHNTLTPAATDAATGIITEFPVPTASSYLQGITAGPDGNLWFTEESGNKIGRITTSGTLTEFPLPTAGSVPWSITAGSDGNLWFTEFGGNKIGRITPSK